jgi:RNA polymerase sigma-70 factor (sigma-E family)
VSDEKISPHDAGELAACFAAHARDLFGYACVFVQGDRALADNLVQAAFEAAGRAWPGLRSTAEDQRRGWLRQTLATIAVSGLGGEAAFGGPQGGDGAESQFGGGYDLAAGLERYTGWLREQTEAPVLPDAVLPDAVLPDAVLPDAAAGSSQVSEWSADHAVSELYGLHYRGLVRLAAMLVRDTPTAEEVVQDSFVAMHAGWQRLRDSEKALAYLRQAVVNRSRSVLRHRTVVEKNAQAALPDMPSAEHGAFVLLERSAVIAALRDLPQRQREAIVLRYYADLSEADIAATMGISQGAVKSHTSRAIAALRAALEQELWREPGRARGHKGPVASLRRVRSPRFTPPRTRSSRRQSLNSQPVLNRDDGFRGYPRDRGQGRAPLVSGQSLPEQSVHASTEVSVHGRHKRRCHRR